MLCPRVVQKLVAKPGFFPAPTPPIRWICHDAEGRCANFRAESTRQSMNRRGTIHLLKALWPPWGFALEGLTNAKRVYEKTARRWALRASQELHHAERLQRLKDEHRFLLTRERPAVTKVVAWAASTDEVDPDRDHISWVSPLARALMKSAAGDRVVLRYTHRVAISNHRLLAFDDNNVTFRWRDYAHGNVQRTMTNFGRGVPSAGSCCTYSQRALSASDTLDSWLTTSVPLHSNSAASCWQWRHFPLLQKRFRPRRRGGVPPVRRP